MPAPEEVISSQGKGRATKIRIKEKMGSAATAANANQLEFSWVELRRATCEVTKSIIELIEMPNNARNLRLSFYDY